EVAEKSPKHKEIMESWFGGPDLSDTTPNLIDPELVNWDEIHHNIHAEHDEEQQYEAEDQRLKGEGLTHAMPGHTDETNKMLDAWMKHHGVPDEGGSPYDTPIHVPIEHLEQGYGQYHYPEDFGEPHAAEIAQQGYWKEPIRDLGWHTLNRVQKGLETPYAETMKQALVGQGYPPEQVQHIMRPQWRQVPGEVPDGPIGGKPGLTWERIEPKPKPVGPDPALDQPGKDVFPSEWNSHILAAVVGRTAANEAEGVVFGETPTMKNDLMRWTPGMVGGGLVINGEPHTWNMRDAEGQSIGPSHGNYPTSLGIDRRYVDWKSGVDIGPNGELKDEFKRKDLTPYFTADPRLKPIEVQTPSGPTMANHSRTNNMEPYETLWTAGPEMQLEPREAGLWGDLGSAALGAGLMAGGLALAPETGGASLALDAAGAGELGAGAAEGAGAATDASGGIGGLMKGAIKGGPGAITKGLGIQEGLGMGEQALGLGGGGAGGGEAAGGGGA